eukprot:2193508-Heterocapsa_arctica.AAC.1
MELMMEQINDLRREVTTLRAGASPPRADMAHSVFRQSQEDIVMAEPAGVNQIFQQPQPPPVPAVIQGSWTIPSPWTAAPQMPGQAAPMASPALIVDRTGTAPLHLVF